MADPRVVVNTGSTKVRLGSLATPTQNDEAATKAYVDSNSGGSGIETWVSGQGYTLGDLVVAQIPSDFFNESLRSLHRVFRCAVTYDSSNSHASTNPASNINWEFLSNNSVYENFDVVAPAGENFTGTSGHVLVAHNATGGVSLGQVSTNGIANDAITESKIHNDVITRDHFSTFANAGFTLNDPGLVPAGTTGGTLLNQTGARQIVTWTPVPSTATNVADMTGITGMSVNNTQSLVLSNSTRKIMFYQNDTNYAVFNATFVLGGNAVNAGGLTTVQVVGSPTVANSLFFVPFSDINFTQDQELFLDSTGVLKRNGVFDMLGGGDIADNAITTDQLNVSGVGLSGQYLASDADGSFSWRNVSDNIANGSITTTQIADGTITASDLNVLGNGANGEHLTSEGDGTFIWRPEEVFHGSTQGDVPAPGPELYTRVNPTPSAALQGMFGGGFDSTSNGWGHPNQHSVTFTGSGAAENAKVVRAAGEITYIVYQSESVYGVFQATFNQSSGNTASVIAGLGNIKTIYTVGTRPVGIFTMIMGVDSSGNSVNLYNHDTRVVNSEANWTKVNADLLDVTGNGTAGQVLSSDGDGSFSWVDDANTDTTYSVVTATTDGLVPKTLDSIIDDIDDTTVTAYSARFINDRVNVAAAGEVNIAYSEGANSFFISQWNQLEPEGRSLFLRFNDSGVTNQGTLPASNTLLTGREILLYGDINNWAVLSIGSNVRITYSGNTKLIQEITANTVEVVSYRGSVPSNGSGLSVYISNANQVYSVASGVDGAGTYGLQLNSSGAVVGYARSLGVGNTESTFLEFGAVGNVFVYNTDGNISYIRGVIAETTHTKFFNYNTDGDITSIVIYSGALTTPTGTPVATKTIAYDASGNVMSTTYS